MSGLSGLLAKISGSFGHTRRVIMELPTAVRAA
jgi:hypothetical protein